MQKLQKFYHSKNFQKHFWRYSYKVSRGEFWGAVYASIWHICGFHVRTHKMTIFSHFCRNLCICHLSALRLKIFRPTSTYDPKLNPQSIFQHNSKTLRRYVTSKLFISQGQYLMSPIWPGHKWFCKWINRRYRDVCSKSLLQLLTAWHWILKDSF